MKKRKNKNSFTSTAHAKINLCLQLVDKRKDGYHNIESLIVFVEEGDFIEIKPAKNFALHIKGKFSSALPGKKDNLIYRAYTGLQKEFAYKRKLPAFKIILTKNLPVSSGIGGGSADAATVINLLCSLWKIKPEKNKFQKFLLDLGADIPVCLLSKAAYINKTGEVHKILKKTPKLPVLLVNPAIPLSTKKVFASKNKSFSGLLENYPASLDKSKLISFLQHTANDLQGAAMTIVPQIRKILFEIGRQPGCLVTRMSGSGATCYGIFDSYTQLNKAYADIKKTHPNWWVCKTKTL